MVEEFVTWEYPTQVNNDYKKYYFCYWVKEQMRLLYNHSGQKYRDGEISLAEFQKFVDDWYENREWVMFEEIARLRTDSTKEPWGVNWFDVFVVSGQ